MTTRKPRTKETKPRKPGGGRKHKLTERQRAALRKSTLTIRELAKQYGVSEMTIWNCKNKGAKQ
jgi:predicted DNA binding protein